MNRELIKEWVTTLRSGRYKQGKGCLKSGDHYCCLGVLCDIVNPKGWDGPYFIDENSGLYSNYLPDSIREQNFPRLNQYELADMNDNDKSFAEIADYIEEKYLCQES